jgi:hypothetical protein
MNPPFDLGDPQFAAREISQAEFEQAWERGERQILTGDGRLASMLAGLGSA